jgi:hypothetical protein
VTSARHNHEKVISRRVKTVIKRILGFIVVLEGEDGVNVIDKKTAVQPVVQVVDRNTLPVSGASVTFVLGGNGASFANGARQVIVTTDAAGRAATAAPARRPATRRAPFLRPPCRSRDQVDR